MKDESAEEPPESSVLTQLARGGRSGRIEPLDQLFERLYRELRAMAHHQLRQQLAEGAIVSLCATQRGSAFRLSSRRH
jgi:transcriptional regulatory protein LevR